MRISSFETVFQQPANKSPIQQGGTTTFGTYLSCTGGIEYGVPGNCGAAGGFGSHGSYVLSAGGQMNGGATPFVYGSGGNVFRCAGCSGNYPTIGSAGTPGVVIVDVLY